MAMFRFKILVFCPAPVAGYSGKGPNGGYQLPPKAVSRYAAGQAYTRRDS